MQTLCFHIYCQVILHQRFSGGSDVKNPPAMWETWVQSLGWECLLEEGMETHPTFLPGRITVDRRAWLPAWVAKSQTQLENLRKHLSMMNTGSHAMLWELSSLSPSLFFFPSIIYLTSYPFLLFFLGSSLTILALFSNKLDTSSGEKYDLQCF